MKIDAITVSVRYSDLLRKGIDGWKRGLDSLLVVTTPDDRDTIRLCEAWDVPTYQTDAFYRDGAAFNKGRAIAEAYDVLKPSDWCLFLDSDIIPPAGWRSEVESAGIEPGNLYGARRTTEAGTLIDDGEMPGYFHLFHTSDPALQSPIVDTCWTHAGAYDSYFMLQWAPWERIWLPFSVTHQGEIGVNWFGRGNVEAVRRMREERAARGGHMHERIILPERTT